MTTAQIHLPPKLIPVFTPPRGDVRYRGAYGGRGSGKSFSFALIAAVFGYAEPMRILCTRELQVSIKESMYAELKNAIASQPWLQAHYEIGESYIRGANGTEFIFRGLRHNISSIKSMAQIDLCIVEEAEDVPEHSWLALLPTVRAPRSEIWPIWNSRLDGSPVDQRFIKSCPDNAIVVQMNYGDNPWFPAVLEDQRQHDQERMDPATYAHVWEGCYLENSDAQVLHGKVAVRTFTPDSEWDGPYYGIDFGFANDPTAAVECWIHTPTDTLGIYRECGGTQVEVSDTAPLMLKAMPDAARHVVRGDAARPETVSAMKRSGIPRAESAPKWQGSVEDGIQHLRSYREIVVHPDCQEVTRETRLYSYKVDRHTGEIRPEPVDAMNHYIDAIRYALAPIIKKREIPAFKVKMN